MKKIICMVKNLFYHYSILKSISKKSKFFDLILSRLLINLPYDRYIDYCFYEKPWAGRKDYLYNELEYYLKYNPGVTRDNHDDKSDIMNKIQAYLKRKLLKTKNMSYDDFKLFVQDLDTFFYKPLDGDSGKGIEKIIVNENTENIFSYIKNKSDGILEETVIQHEDMDLLNPNLVQTIRFFVYVKKEGATIIFSSLRTSLKDNVCVDNAGAGGCFVNVDLSTGKIITNAYCETHALKKEFDINLIMKDGISTHPVSGTTFKGFKIPFFDEAKQLVLDIANNVDFYGRKLLGFDIAISKNGPIVIEVNANRPDISLWQIPLKHIPLRPIFEKEITS